MNSIVFGTAILLAAPAIKDKEKEKDPGIVGEWTIEKTIVGGREIPKPRDGMTYDYMADGNYLTRKDGVESKGTRRGYKIDTTKVPAELDFDAGPAGKPIWVPGIFKIEGDTLTVCVDAGTGKRPTSFEPMKGDRVSVTVFTRVKKKE